MRLDLLAFLGALEVAQRPPDVRQGALLRVGGAVQEDRQTVLQRFACATSTIRQSTMHICSINPHGDVDCLDRYKGRAHISMC